MPPNNREIQKQGQKYHGFRHNAKRPQIKRRDQQIKQYQNEVEKDKISRIHGFFRHLSFQQCIF
jgi:hypothetical protein